MEPVNVCEATKRTAWFHITDFLYLFLADLVKVGNYQVKLGNYLVIFKVKETGKLQIRYRLYPLPGPILGNYPRRCSAISIRIVLTTEGLKYNSVHVSMVV